MKKLILLFVLIALSINSCTDSSVEPDLPQFNGTIYYLANYQSQLFRISSTEKKLINTGQFGVSHFPSAPVGNKLFYTVGGEGNKNLVVTDSEGSTTTHFAEAYEPIAILSPNGSYVAYTVFSHLGYGITIYNTANKTEQALPVSKIFKKSIIFSPDESKIAFFKGQNGDSLFISNLDGTEQRFILEQNSINTLDWSPDGQKIVYIHNSNQISIINVNTLDIKQLNTDFEYEAGIKWMPDSKRVFYTSGIDGYGITMENFNGSHIELLNTETGEKQILLQSEKALYFPQVSPDGNDILYIEAPLREGGSLNIVNLTTLKTIKIVDDAHTAFWKK